MKLVNKYTTGDCTFYIYHIKKCVFVTIYESKEDPEKWAQVYFYCSYGPFEKQYAINKKHVESDYDIDQLTQDVHSNLIPVTVSPNILNEEIVKRWYIGELRKDKIKKIVSRWN